MSLSDLPDDLREAAKEIAGNWKKFESFGWHAEPKDRPEDCAIVYLSNRDSGCLDQSNEAAILAELKPWTGEIDEGDLVETQNHNHWAVGYVDGIVIRVLDGKGEPTPAFAKLHELARKMADYPVLDEEDFSERETEEEWESWKNFGGDDFIRELVKVMPHHETLFGSVSYDHLLRVWRELEGDTGGHVIHEDSGCFFPFDRKFGERAGACRVDASDVRAAFLAVAAEDRRYGMRQRKAAS